MLLTKHAIIIVTICILHMTLLFNFADLSHSGNSKEILGGNNIITYVHSRKLIYLYNVIFRLVDSLNKDSLSLTDNICMYMLTIESPN